MKLKMTMSNLLILVMALLPLGAMAIDQEKTDVLNRLANERHDRSCRDIVLPTTVNVGEDTLVIDLSGAKIASTLSQDTDQTVRVIGVGDRSYLLVQNLSENSFEVFEYNAGGVAIQVVDNWLKELSQRLGAGRVDQALPVKFIGQEGASNYMGFLVLYGSDGIMVSVDSRATDIRVDEGYLLNGSAFVVRAGPNDNVLLSIESGDNSSAAHSTVNGLAKPYKD